MHRFRMAVVIASLLAFAVPSVHAGFAERGITGDFGQSLFAMAGDLDEDGWTDIITSDTTPDIICWIKGVGGEFAAPTMIDTLVNGAIQGRFIDLDFDGDVDVIGAMWGGSVALWWENDGSLSFTEHTIGILGNAHSALPVDIDEDGDYDVVVCGNAGGSAWFENDGAMQFAHRTLVSGITSQYCDAGDLDGDGDIDLLTNDFDSGVRWWENDGNENFASHLLSFPGAHSVRAFDMDGDDDLDVLCGAYNPSAVRWWENDGAGGFTAYDVPTTTVGMIMADPCDFDLDGDVDICGGGEQSDDVVWWENDGAMDFTEYVLADGTLNSVQTCWAFDVDDDGDGDILAAGRSDPDVRWFENDAVSCAITPDPPAGVAPLTVSFAGVVTAPLAVSAYEWDFDGDGSTDATGPEPEWTFHEPGIYDVLVTYDVGDTNGKYIVRECVRVFDASSGMEFEGETEHTETPAAAGIGLTGAFTVEAWINPSGWGTFSFGSFGYGHILSKGPVSLYLVGGHFARNDHSLFLDITHADATVSGSGSPENSIVLDVWQHVAVVYDGVGTAMMYIDGEEVVVTHTTAPSGAVAANAADPLGLGNTLPDLNMGFEGVIDEVRVWNVARTGGEIADNMLVTLEGTEPGLAGYWRLDEGYGSVVVDATGTCDDGMVTGGEWVQGVVLYPTGVEDDPVEGVASRARLLPNHPNPFNPLTCIAFELPYAGDVSLQVFDAAGRHVRTLLAGELGPGAHSIAWDGRGDTGKRLASGVYLYRLTSSDGCESRKMVLLK